VRVKGVEREATGVEGNEADQRVTILGGHTILGPSWKTGAKCSGSAFTWEEGRRVGGSLLQVMQVVQVV